MGIEVQTNCFESQADALEEIKRLSLWPTTILVEKAPEAELHWHAEDAYVYLIEGSMYYLDGDGKRYDIAAGDKITVPARTIHAEGEITSRVVLLIGIPEPTPKGGFLVVRNVDEL